jgi:diphosphomevalonate decarboxylase
MKYWFAEAPSNIALIKYMGKKDPSLNIPANPSLSYTLPNLKSFVELTSFPGSLDYWEPLETPGSKPFELSQKSQERFIKHLNMLKEIFNYSGNFIVRSTNNFPLGSGLASSASSFAALTKCACIALSELTNQAIPDDFVQAQLSRLGSGSSCRSFFSPWAFWEDEYCEKIDLPYRELIHHVIIISEEEKSISSKQAHLAVQSSPHYQFRTTRANERLQALIAAFKSHLWAEAYQICWDEFLDMHNLFSTCDTPFHYITPESQNVLNILQIFWKKNQDGPIVTMDAGPNIHLLFRQDQAEMAKFFIQEYIVNQYDYL